MSKERMFNQTPVIKLGDTFKKIANFQKRFRTIPNLLELDHLTVSVSFIPLSSPLSMSKRKKGLELMCVFHGAT